MPPAPDPVPSTMADFAALGRLCEEHQPKLLAMLERRIDPRLRQRIDPEDVLQNTFLAAQRRWSEYQGGSAMRPYPWLYRLALDALLEAYKTNHRDIRDQDRDVPWPDESSVLFADRFGGVGSSPSRNLAREELADRVRQVIDLLDRTEREILWMRHFEGLSARDTGEIVGLSEAAVNTRQFRTLRKLETIWRKLYGEPGTMP